MLQPRRIKHCRACGTLVQYLIPSDDNRERAVCSECGTVHYENPLNVVGTLPVWGDHVLLCKRNIEPRFGKWTLPAGFMELGETTEAGALRETDEEAGAQVELQGLFTMLNVAQIGQVHFFYRARLLHTDFNPGLETSEARLFLDRIEKEIAAAEGRLMHFDGENIFGAGSNHVPRNPQPMVKAFLAVG